MAQTAIRLDLLVQLVQRGVLGDGIVMQVAHSGRECEVGLEDVLLKRQLLFCSALLLLLGRV